MPRISARLSNFLIGSAHRRAEHDLKSHAKTPAENAQIPITNKLKMRGVGITRYSVLFPFGRRSKSVFQAKPRMWAPANNDDVNTGRTDTPAYEPRYFAPVHVPIAAKLTVQLDIFRDASFQTNLLKKCAIAFDNKDAIDPHLMQVLDECGNKLKTDKLELNAARLPLLLGLQRACEDTAAAHGGLTPSEADVARALAHLQTIDLQRSVLDPGAPADAPPTSEQEQRAVDLAWRLVYKLAVTERGMEFLHRLTNPVQPDPAAPVDIAEKDRQRRQHLNLKHFFKVADSLLDEHDDNRAPPLRPTPAALLDHCMTQCELPEAPQNTLLIHGLTGIQTALCKEEPTNPPCMWQKRIDATNIRTANIEVAQRHVEAMRKFGQFCSKEFADQLATKNRRLLDGCQQLRVRQQAAMADRFAYKWVSDGHVSNAPGSMLHTIDQRFKKMEIYQQRRRDRDTRSGFKAFVKRTSEVVKGSKRTFIPKPRTENPQHNPDSMLLHREKMQSSLAMVEEMLLRSGGPRSTAPQPLDPTAYVLEPRLPRPVLKNIAQLALIRSWLKQPLHYLSNDMAPTVFDIDKLCSRAKLQELFGDYPALRTDGPQRSAFIDAFRAELTRPILTPELLAQWVQQIPIDPATNDYACGSIAGRQHADKTNEQLRNQFEQTIAFMQNGWQSTLTPTGDTVTDFNQMLAEQIEQMRLGNLRTFSGGSSHGGGLPAFSSAITMIKSLGTLNVLVGATYSHRGLVNLEVGIASWGGFVRVTTSHEDQGGANLGLTVGPKAELGSAMGGAAVYTDAEAAASSFRARGYCFCLPRGGSAMTGRTGVKGGVAGDDQIAAGLAQIWRIISEPAAAELDAGAAAGVAPGTAPGPMDKLRRIGAEVPDVSVSIVGPGDSHAEEGFVGGRLGSIFGLMNHTKQFGIGLNLSAALTRTRRRSKYRQRNSALQVEVVNRSLRHSLGVQANLPLRSGLGIKQGAAAAFNNGAKTIAGPLFGMGGVNAEIWKHGRAAQTNRVIYEGKISKNTYANAFYTNAKQFCDAAEKDIARWANYMASHDADCPKEGTAPDVRDEQGRTVADIRQCLVEKHTQSIRKYLARVKREVHQSDVYFDFLELTPESTELLNHYYESEIEFRAAGRDVEADLCKKAFDAVWQHEDAWAPWFIVNSKPQQSNSGWSFNLLLSAASEQPETSNRFPNYCG